MHTISLPRARELARECRELRLQGIDPITHRRASLAARRASDAKATTFQQCADAFIASHESGWHNASHRSQWVNTLAQPVYPTLGDLSVADIDTALVMKTIEPIWKTIPETASRLRGRIEAILDWAKVSGYRMGENPARWRGHLDHLLPARAKVARVKHHAALPYAEIGAFMATLRQNGSVGASALEFTILTAARTGEALGATWDEFDAKVWTIPAERMKGGREHRVPLSDAALALLRQMRGVRTNDFVFPDGGGAAPKTMQLVLRRMGHGGTVHDFVPRFAIGLPSKLHSRPNWLRWRSPIPLEARLRPPIVGLTCSTNAGSSTAWADYCAKPSSSGTVTRSGRRGHETQPARKRRLYKARTAIRTDAIQKHYGPRFTATRVQKTPDQRSEAIAEIARLAKIPTINSEHFCGTVWNIFWGPSKLRGSSRRPAS
jgi:integrase